MKEDVVPAILFIGETVTVMTKIERPMPPEEIAVDEEDGPLMSEGNVQTLMIRGVVLESDATYLTLGNVNEDGVPKPKIAIKHEDISFIELDEDEAVDFMPSFEDDTMLN